MSRSVADAGGPVGAPVGHRRRGVSLTTRLAATVLGVGFLSMVAATMVGVSAGQTLGREIVSDAVNALRAISTSDVSAQVDSYERLAGQLAGSPQAALALDSFARGVSELSAIPPADLRDARRQLLDAYQETHFGPLAELGETVQVSDIMSNSSAAVYLQSNYSIPPEPISDPIVVSDAGDGSAWSATHATFHPGYRTAVVQAGLLDVYLVEGDSLRVVYSAAKAPDLGTSLTVGPFGGSVVARAAEQTLTRDESIVTDVSFYRAQPGIAVGAAAAPIRADGDTVGAVVVTYDAQVFTDLLTEVANAGAAAAGELTDGELYLIGGDGTTRSDPQSYQRDPQAFLEASEQAGLITTEDRSVIETLGTTVLIQTADDATLNSGAQSATAATLGRGLAGTEVLVTLEPVASDLGWYTVAEIPATAAEAAVASFRKVLLFGSAVFLVVLAFVAVAWSKGFMRPVRIISDRLGSTALERESSDDGAPMRIPDRSPVEFHRLIDILNDMGATLRRQQRDLRRARNERVQVLQSMLPESIAKRVARGEIEGLDQVPSASVVVVVVLGLGELTGDTEGNRALVDELHAELDAIALEHGLDRVKVVGDSYYGACGHDRPYLDHAPRAVAFARAVSGTVQAIGQASATSLSTAIGINTGAVTVGMSGGERLVYDVWGPTVSTAHALARTARAGQVVMNQTTRDRLPDDVDVQPWPQPDHGLATGATGLAAGRPSALWQLVTAEPQPATTEAQVGR